jgi:signal transduction histidine kinase
MRTRLDIPSLIGSRASADKGHVQKAHRDDFSAFLWGEILLIGLLGASLALFLAHPSLHARYDLPQLHLVLQTVIFVAAGIVAVLAGVRFAVEGRRVDLLLSAGFFIGAVSALAFEVIPVLGGNEVQAPEAWAGIVGRMLAWVLIAAAAFARGNSRHRERALGNAIVFSGVLLVIAWTALRSVREVLPPLDPRQAEELPFLLTGAIAAQALLNLLAVVGWGQRFRTRGDDLYRWVALGSTLMLFASLHFVFTPLLGSSYVSQGDFLRMLGYGVLLVGAWRAIRFAEFGRAVAEERARVAREIHDGLAQYLFAVSTHASMLESDGPKQETIAALKEAAAAAQQEARFAILALSSAAGSAPFDAALQRYVEFLTADGELAVDLDIDRNIKLAPDEQIEIFRIVQEGLANVRKHANATRAEVTIGDRFGERFVTIRDDGEGFDGESRDAGQGLKNMRQRAESIDGGFTLVSKRGHGTALEVVLRA